MGRGIATLVLSVIAAALLVPLRTTATTSDSATMNGLRQLVGGTIIQWAAHLAPPSVRDMPPASAVRPKRKSTAHIPSKPKPPAASPTPRMSSTPAPAPVPAAAPAAAGALHLDGIMLTPEPPTVMVNGQVLRIGEWIGGYRVVKIIPQGVYLHQPPDGWFLLTTDQQLRRVEVRQ